MWVCRACFATEVSTCALLHWEVETLHNRALVNYIFVSSRFKGQKRAQSSFVVGSVKNLRLDLDLYMLSPFGDVSGHIIVVMLRTFSQTIETVVSGRLKISVSRLNDASQLTRSASAFPTTVTSRFPVTDTPATGRFVGFHPSPCKMKMRDLDFPPLAQHKDLWWRGPPLPQSWLFIQYDDFDYLRRFNEGCSCEDCVRIVRVMVPSIIFRAWS